MDEDQQIAFLEVLTKLDGGVTLYKHCPSHQIGEDGSRHCNASSLRLLKSVSLPKLYIIPCKNHIEAYLKSSAFWEVIV